MIFSDLCSLIGVSGYENEVINYLYSAISKSKKCVEIYKDTIGNLICLRRGKPSGKNIVITAHADEVGFQVMNKLNKDKFYIKALGSVKTWNAANQPVKSKSAFGTIYAVDYNNLQANNFNNLYLMRLKGKIQIGDVFTFARPFQEGEKYYSGKSLDNRASCYCLYELIMSDISSINNIYYVFTVQEEITMRGSRAAKTSLKPDLCITLDLSPENEMNSIKTGAGVGIKISDSIGVSSIKYLELAKNIAQKYNIKHQFEVSDCGTSELVISNELDNGFYELGISIPCKFIHSANTLIYKDDLKQTIALMQKIIASL